MKTSDKSDISLALDVSESPYNFSEIFSNDNPVELEVGIGKGRFLINEAEERSETNFIGIEWAAKYHRMACERAAHRKLTNIRFLRDDASHTFTHALAEDSLSALHVYFPDPWPKKRHHKRRLIQTPFLDKAIRVCKNSSTLYFATDHVHYFQQIDRVTDEHPNLELIERHIGDAAPEGITNYEVKYREEGRTIHKKLCRIVK